MNTVFNKDYFKNRNGNDDKRMASFESEFKRRKAPEGDPPTGKVWSVEHGHWHDINPPNGSVDGH